MDTSGRQPAPPPPDLSDAEDVALMFRVKDGDKEAFTSLVEKHQSAVVGTVAKMMGDGNDAHDLSQQIFLRVWKSAPRYEKKAKFTTWLFTITRNLVFNECRRQFRKREVSIEEREEHGSSYEARDSSEPRPDDALLQSELEAAVNRAIQELPEKSRLAVVLRRYENLSYEEIGQVLDLTVPAVKSLLFRARNLLKKSLQRYLEQ